MKKILIIEDDTVLGSVMAKKLMNDGNDVQLIQESIESIGKIKEFRPDIILLDIFLPVMTGFDILKLKKADAEIAGIPVLVLSNSLQPIQHQQMYDLGISKFLIKSDVSPADIAVSINGILDHEATHNSLNPNNPSTMTSTDSQASQQPVANPQDSANPVGQPGSIISGKSILIVEDDNFLGGILSTRISNQGGKVTRARTGEDALVALQGGNLDIVLLDILLPGMDGFEVLKRLRSDEKTKDLPVIVISNFNQMSDKEKAASLGAQFLVKALITPDDIVQRVEETLGK